MNKKIAYIVVVLLTIIVLVVFIKFEGKAKQLVDIPFYIGVVSVLIVHSIRKYGEKPDEWN